MEKDYKADTTYLVYRYARVKNMPHGNVWGLLWSVCRREIRIPATTNARTSMTEIVSRADMWDQVYKIAYRLFR